VNYARSPRIALAVLANDLVAEPEMRLLLPDGIAAYAARVDYPPQVTPENLAIAEQNLEAAVRSLAGLRPHVVVWACTSGSFYAGVEAHDHLLRKLQSWAPEAHVMTAASAVVDALTSVGAATVAVGSPYPPEINERLREFLEHNGLRVVRLQQLFTAPVDDWTLQDLSDEQVAQFARETDDAAADAVFISCTGVQAAGIARQLEAELGKPFLTSNIAIASTAARVARDAAMTEAR
jgi:maleate isomerase